ncbi:alanine racemase [Ignavibacteriales bacterium]
MQIRPTKALINLSNLEENYSIITQYASPAKIIAVVKADAYGHGARQIVEKLNTLENPPCIYAVATVEEVIDLQNSFPLLRFLVFEPFNLNMAEALQQFEFEITITSTDQLKMIESLNLSGETGVHVKIDTGMGRLGFKEDEIDGLLKHLTGINKLSIKGVYTHFATSDGFDREFTLKQIECFERVLSKFKEAGISTGIIHTSNTGAIIDYPQAKYDAVRPGISLYGYYKDIETTVALGLKPVMSLVSTLSTVKKFKAGESISYGRSFILETDSWIGTVAAGYADGIRRSLSGKISCAIAGIEYPQVGTITMDRFMVNLGETEYPVGTVVTILSDDLQFNANCWEWCDKMDTIPYEITCGISKRVPRVYEY